MIVVLTLAMLAIGSAPPDVKLCARAVSEVVAERPGRASLAPIRARTCMRIVREARRAGLEPVTAVAIAWRESRLMPGVCSDKGACGPMQAIPRWWCPQRTADGCNLVRAGMRALSHYTGKHRRLSQAICHYGSGNTCNRGGKAYAADVMEMRRTLIGD